MTSGGGTSERIALIGAFAAENERLTLPSRLRYGLPTLMKSQNAKTKILISAKPNGREFVAFNGDSRKTIFP
jgi:hypothetical protein